MNRSDDEPPAENPSATASCQARPQRQFRGVFVRRFFPCWKETRSRLPGPSVFFAKLGRVLRRTAFVFFSNAASRTAAIFDGRPNLISVNSDADAKNRQIQLSRHDPQIAIHQVGAIQFTM